MADVSVWITPKSIGNVCCVNECGAFSLRETTSQKLLGQFYGRIFCESEKSVRIVHSLNAGNNFVDACISVCSY